MKKIFYYIFIMIFIVIIMPLFIVKGCSYGKKSELEPQPLKKGNMADIIVRVLISSENKVVEMPLDEYVKGVVAAEMPAEFEPEALKAQAVAARTYVYGRLKKIYAAKEDLHSGADICTDSTHCQAWESKEDAKKSWGVFSSFAYWNKIEKAVNDTKGVIIVYENNIINPVFHSNSGGRTENAEDVWEGDRVPYLKSVQSNGEDNSGEYRNEVSIKDKDFTDKIRKEYPTLKIEGKDILREINVLAYTEGNRVKSIKIGNVTLRGTDIRRIFSLRSANFKIERGGDGILKITTFGNGHGVGMSQWGANYLAKNGGTYEEILKYYYSGIEIDTIKQ